jgi:tRNA (guanine-N7-)-methyltransferase
VFGNGRPVYLEIGFGNGHALASMASAYPERNYLGIEVHRPGIGHLLLELERLGLTNVRLLRGDAAEIVRRSLPASCLEGVYLFFPDPWPKKRHHKRRIVQPEFVAQLDRVLGPGGFVRMATDWGDYAQHMLGILEAATAFDNAAGAGAYAARPEERPPTRFERRGRRLGHQVWDLFFVKRQD